MNGYGTVPENNKSYPAYPNTRTLPYWLTVVSLVLSILSFLATAGFAVYYLIQLADTAIDMNRWKTCPAVFPPEQDYTNHTIKLCGRYVAETGNYSSYQGFIPTAQRVLEPSPYMRVGITGDIRNNLQVFRSKYGFVFEGDPSNAVVDGTGQAFFPGTNLFAELGRDGFSVMRFFSDIYFGNVATLNSLTTITLNILSDPRAKRNITNAGYADSVVFIRMAQIINYALSPEVAKGFGASEFRTYRGFNASQLADQFPRFVTTGRIPAMVNGTRVFQDRLQVRFEEVTIATVQTTQYLLNAIDRQASRIATLEALVATQRNEIDIIKADIALIKLQPTPK